MLRHSKMSIVKQLSILVFSVMILPKAPSLFANVTYWFDSSVPADARASIEEAVPIYNKYGSFNKHLSVYYNSGIPTAESNYTGYIGFGGSRNTRVALHEICHTMGMGTYTGSPSYSSLIVGGVWQGFYGRKRAIEMGSPYADGLHGDGHAVWPWAMNYDSEDSSYMERIKCVRSQAALRCDMGIMSYSKETEHQIVHLGETAMFGVASPIATSYQWYKNGVALTDGGDISGATRPTLQIANVSLSDEGNYYCAAVGASETLNSRSRRLIIQGQVGQWNFENNANDSVGSYNGMPSGSPAYTTGKIGQAIDLDGTNDFVTLPAGVADAKDMTVAAWVYWDGGNQWQRIFDFGASTSNYMFLTPRSGGNTLRFAIKNGGDEQRVDTAQLPTNQWVHLAVTLRNDAATLYVNGQAVASNGSVTMNPVDLLADRNYIGDSQFSADPLFNGRIDDFRIYNDALAGSEIWNLWGQSANNPPMFDADPLILSDGNASVAYTGVTLADDASDPDSDPLTFSKVSGPTWLNVAANGTLSGTPGTADRGENTFVARVTDSSGATDDAAVHITVYGPADAHYEFENTADDSVGSNHGTTTGSPAYTTGIAGDAIDLDGSDDYLTLPSGVVNTEDLTIAAWVNWDGGDIYQRIFDFGNNTTQYMFLTPASAGSTLRFVITGSGNRSREQKIETTELIVGQWVHVAITLSGNTGKLYVNGVLEDINTAMTINPSDFNPTVNYIGKSQWPDPLFNGRIDDFRIYHYALSDTEIAALNSPPSFTSDPISNDAAVELVDYTGQSLADYTDYSGVEILTFSKDAGPNWLVVSPDGTLSGIPSDQHVGENLFTVRVTDNGGLSDTAQMTIQVANVYSGVRGVEDLAGLAAQWLMIDCVDTPACGGADLSGDQDVDMDDFERMSANWLADESLQLHLKLDETSGTVAEDSSIYKRSGELIHGPVWTTDDSRKALSLDGVDDYVLIEDMCGALSDRDITISLWIKSGTKDAQQFLYAFNTAAGENRLMLGRSASDTHLGIYDNGWQTSSTAVFDGSWHSVVLVLSTTLGSCTLYVDGGSVYNYATSTSIDVPDLFSLGQEYDGLVTSDFYEGFMDDVRIYDRALTEQEIQAIANP